MPLFEYSCRACGKRFTFLSGVIADNAEPRCPRCDSAELSKLMSRFARGRSEDERFEALAERMETKDLDDASALRQFAREMGREMSAETGEDVSEEMESLIEAEARGENEFGSETFGSDRFGAPSSNRDDGKIY